MSEPTREESRQLAPAGWGDGGGALAIADREVGAAAAVAREESEIKAAIVIARRFPRSEETAYTKVMKSCGRPNFAEEAMYRFPRGKATIEGPSVDMAREIARNWGNIRYGLRIVSVDKEMVHIKGWCLDLETNAYIEHEDKFARLIQRVQKDGKTAWVEPDERDLRELVNRRGAILVRNAILQVIPPDLVEDAVAKAKDTMRKAAAGEIEQSKEQAIRRLVMSFDAIGVTVPMLVGFLKHDLNLVTAEELTKLRQIGKSIIDGNSRREEYFEISNQKQQHSSSQETSDLNQKIRGNGNEPAKDPFGETVKVPSKPNDADAEKILREKSAPQSSSAGSAASSTPKPQAEGESKSESEPQTTATAESPAKVPADASHEWFAYQVTQKLGCTESEANSKIKLKLKKPWDKLKQPERDAALRQLLNGEWS